MIHPFREMPTPLAALKHKIQQVIHFYYFPSALLVLLYGALISNKFIAESQGSLLDFYQNISPDGYDWISQGDQLSNYLFRSAQLTQVPLLRDPGFTFTLAVDHLLGGNGVVLGLVQGACFVAINGAILYLASRMANLTEPHGKAARLANNLFCCALILGNPLNWVFSWVLAEPLAVLASLIPLILLIRNSQSWLDPKTWLFAGVIAGFSTLIQTYAFLPFACATAVGILERCSFNPKKPSIQLPLPTALSFIVCLLISAGSKAAWRALIPHESVPASFSLLRVSPNMINFYWHTWTFVFLLPLIVLLCCLLRHTWLLIRKPALRHLQQNPSDANRHRSRVTKLVIVTIATLGTLCLFYQWEESRFSFLIYPYLFALTIAAFQKLSASILSAKARLLAFLLYGLLSFALIYRLESGNIWQPSLSDASLRIMELPQPSESESRNLRCELLDSSSSFKDSTAKDPYLSNIINFRERLCLL